MSTSKTSQSTQTKQQVLSHFIARKIRENGGPVDLDTTVYAVSDVADITAEEAHDLITDGEGNIYQLARGPNQGQQVTNVLPVGQEPSVVTDRFGEPDTTGANFTRLQSISPAVEEALQTAGYNDYRDLASADPEDIAHEINDGLEAQATPADFDSLTGLTESETTALQNIGITTKRDLAQAAPETVAEEAPAATLTEAKVTSAKQQVASDVTIYSTSDGEAIVDAAQMAVPTGPDIARQQLEQHRARVDTVGEAAAIVTDVEEQTETVGEPLADVNPSIGPKDSEAVYVSDIGHNKNDPVNTGFHILEDVGYDLVPKPETDPNAGHEALPVDEDGNVIPPTVPLERDLKLPLDELIAKKLGRNVPVRVVGPRGSGKNYLLKYLCYKTNRGYRSLDVDKSTMPQDLFGPIAPNENGKLEPKNAEVKQGLLNGDVIVLNEFPVMTAGAAMSLHQLLNENKLVIKSHGQEIKPHPQARVVITMNPPTREYRDSEPMNSATRGRFRSFWQGYPDNVDDETRALSQQVNDGWTTIDEDTLKRVVEFAHRTRKEEFDNWPTLSTRNLTIVCEHIADGASAKAAVKNVLRMNAEPHHHPEDAFETLGEIL